MSKYKHGPHNTNNVNPWHCLYGRLKKYNTRRNFIMANTDFNSQEYLEKLNAYWRAANYLAAAQLYMLENPLLREPLT